MSLNRRPTLIRVFLPGFSTRLENISTYQSLNSERLKPIYENQNPLPAELCVQDQILDPHPDEEDESSSSPPLKEEGLSGGDGGRILHNLFISLPES